MMQEPTPIELAAMIQLQVRQTTELAFVLCDMCYTCVVDHVLSLACAFPFDSSAHVHVAF